MMATTTDLYGVDFKLEEKDLTLSSSGGYDIYSSEDNLLQSINNRLSTELGSLVYDPAYGVDLSLVIGEKNIPIKTQILRSSIATALKAEPRIATITRLEVINNPTNPQIIYVSIEVLPINSMTTITTNLIYPTYLNQTNLRVSDETTTSVSKFVVDTQYDIYSVAGIYLYTDTNKAGKNYFYDPASNESGYFSSKRITLLEELPTTTTQVIIDYNRSGVELV